MGPSDWSEVSPGPNAPRDRPGPGDKSPRPSSKKREGRDDGEGNASLASGTRASGTVGRGPGGVVPIRPGSPSWSGILILSGDVLAGVNGLPGPGDKPSVRPWAKREGWVDGDGAAAGSNVSLLGGVQQQKGKPGKCR